MLKTAICNQPFWLKLRSIDNLFARGKYENFKGRRVLTKMILVMKLAVILLTVGFLNVNATGVSQNIRFSGKRVPLPEVFSSVERQTGFLFMYMEPVLESSKPVTIKADNIPLEQFLSEVFKRQPLQYDIRGKTIFISLKPAVPSTERKSSNELFGVNAEALIDVRGRIVNENGEPMQGVSVMVKGINKGTTSDITGAFQITVEESETVELEFSFIGYENKTIRVGNQRDFIITLTKLNAELSDVVVVGYGTQKITNVTGSISSVSAKQLKDRPVSSFSEAIAGQVAGVQVQQTSSAPGGGIVLKIRGISSVSASNTPLYVIDGLPIDNTSSESFAQGRGAGDQSPMNPLTSINPEDIESIDILKDASATAIYGSRGSNGVILITTKKGTRGKSKVGLTVSGGWQDVEKKVPIMSLEQFVQRQIDAKNISWVRVGGQASDPNSARTSEFYKIPDEYKDLSKIQYHDWQNDLYRTAPIQNYQLSVSGGNENVQHYISANYMDQEGVSIGSGFKKYSLRGNIDAKVTDRIQVGLRIAPTFSITKQNQASGIYGTSTRALSTLPVYPLYFSDGRYANSFTFHYDDGSSTTDGYLNPVAQSYGINDLVEQFSTIGTLFASVKVLKDLTFRSSFNADVNSFLNNRYYGPYVFNASTGDARAFNSRNITWVNENTLTYENTLGDKNHITVLAGFTSQKSALKTSFVSARGYTDDRIQTINAGIISGGSSIESRSSLLSMLARLNYNYDDRYLLTATVRRDGSSRFGSANRWGVFPSASVGWRISEEKFMSKLPFVSELKIRGSYGLTGNNQIGDYTAYGLIEPDWNYVLGAGNGDVVAGSIQSTIANPSLGWEKGKQIDAGFELGLFQNLLFFTVDYYDKLTSDLLLFVPVPQSTGFTDALRNIGSVRNKGVELSLQTRNIKSKDFLWTSNLNISFNKNKVETLGLTGAPIIAAQRAVENDLTHITKLCSPLGSYYGYIFDGVFANQQELDKYPSLPGTLVGDARFRDINNDGSITIEDQTVIGDNYPDFTYGISNTISFKGFDLNVLLQGVQGVEVLNLAKRTPYRDIGASFSSYWKSPAEPGDGRNFQPGESSNNRLISSWYVEDASYFRIKNVTLGYRLPSKLFGRTDVVQDARLYMNIQNLHTFSKYTGYNPDVNTTEGNPYISSSLTPGIDYGSYPFIRTITFGLNLVF